MMRGRGAETTLDPRVEREVHAAPKIRERKNDVYRRGLRKDCYRRGGSSGNAKG